MSQFTEDFLYMDPDTGELVCMTLDDSGFRVLDAADIAQGLSGQAVARASEQVSLAHDGLDAFVRRYERSYPPTDKSEWDDDLDANDLLDCPAPGM